MSRGALLPSVWTSFAVAYHLRAYWISDQPYIARDGSLFGLIASVYNAIESCTPAFVVLPIDGDQLEEAEARLLGEMLKAYNIDFSYSGIKTQQLLDGESDLTYEEMQFILKDNKTTQVLAMNLRQELQSSELGMQCG